METRPRTHDERRIRALRYFARLAARDAGYILRGVSGWAHADDVQRTHDGYRWGETLSRMAAAGHLDRVLASVPEARRPSYVYRITEEGVREARALLAEPLPPVAPPGPLERTPRIYTRPGGRVALEALREAYRREPRARRMNGEPGWLTPSELRQPSEEWNRRYGSVGHYRTIQDTDILALLQAGLMEKTRVTLSWGRDQPVVLYRATEAGRTADLLEWHEPEGDERIENRSCDEWRPSRLMLGGGH